MGTRGVSALEWSANIHYATEGLDLAQGYTKLTLSPTISQWHLNKQEQVALAKDPNIVNINITTSLPLVLHVRLFDSLNIL